MQFIAPFLGELLSECNALINCRNGTNVLLNDHSCLLLGSGFKLDVVSYNGQ